MNGTTYPKSNLTDIPKIITLNRVKKNQSAKIIKLDVKDLKLRQRLLDMGLTKNTVVTIKKIAPFGSPITLKLRDYELSIRKQDLASIIVEVIL